MATATTTAVMGPQSLLTYWTMVTNGIEVSNIRPASRTEPEIAMLRLSTEAYKELKSDPLLFLHKYNIFERPLNGIRSFSEKPERRLGASEKSVWYLNASHNLYCDVDLFAFESPAVE